MIFYADDDQDDIQIFREIADELEVELLTFTTGSALLDQLKSPPPRPSLIFLDINMPGYNGIQILEMIRTDDHWKDVPIIMFTTSVGEDNIRKSLLLGATYYLPKNPDYEGLKDSIRYVIEQEWKDFLPRKGNFVHPGSSMFSVPKDFLPDGKE